ncbi:hypothetical protein KGM_211267A, partial [Danaus plexippus plexippus]
MRREMPNTVSCYIRYRANLSWSSGNNLR